MKEVFPKRPYAVIEGFLPNSNFPQNVKRQPKTILYTGSLNTALGVDRLLEAFEKLKIMNTNCGYAVQVGFSQKLKHIQRKIEE